MTFINFLVFVVRKLLHNLVFAQKFLFANNCWRKQISKSIQANIAFISNALSGTVNVFS